MYSEGVMNQNTDFLNVASHDIDPIAFGLDKSLDLSPVSLLSKDSFSGPFLLFFLVLSDSWSFCSLISSDCLPYFYQLFRREARKISQPIVILNNQKL